MVVPGILGKLCVRLSLFQGLRLVTLERRGNSKWARDLLLSLKVFGNETNCVAWLTLGCTQYVP